MSDVAGAAGAPAANSGGAGQAGQSGSQGGASAPVERGRIGDFSAWSGRTETTPNHQQISVQDPSLLGRTETATAELDDGSGQQYDFEGLDAQAQALVVDDSAPAEVMTDAQAAEWRKEYEAWKNGDDLPEPFMQKFGSVTIDGQRYRIPVAEAFQGYQRQSDYSYKLRQVYEYRDRLAAQERGLQQLMMDLDDGQRFLDAMVALKKFPGFHKAAMIYGAQLDAEQRMTPEQKALVGNNRALRAQTQQQEMRIRQLEQQVQQTQVQQPSRDQTVIMNQLAQIIPRAAERVGWVDSPAAKREFELHFENMLPTLDGGDVTTQFVIDVMQAAMQSVQAHLRAAEQNPQQLAAAVPIAPPARRQVAPPPPGRGLPGPAPSAQNQNGMPKRARIGDLGSLVGRR